MNKGLKNDSEFREIIDEIIQNETVQEMKKYRHHAETDCFEHCYHVAQHCYRIAKFLHLDYKAITRAAMLHDLFLYDWHEKTTPRRWHGFTHGKISCENASSLFDLTEKEKNMILRHMWPVTPIPPKSIEGFLLTIVDKRCATAETLSDMSKHLPENKILKPVFLVLGFLFFRRRL